jgi:1,4-dihydroxy-2-naphthoate octaprenyltransferase
MTWKSIWLLLRIPFSVFLLPVYLFSLWYAMNEIDAIDLSTTLYAFLILHLLVYPASNGYNSLQDRDTGPIGGLRVPPPPPGQLRWVVLAMDVVALTVGLLLVHPVFFWGVLIYILASRAYSYRGIRLKRFPLTGFLVVFLFQGAWLFLVCLPAFGLMQIDWQDLGVAMAASFLIGAMYPLTQIYQHREDRADHVETISMKLGLLGTFYFSAMCFLIGLIIIGVYTYFADQMIHWVILQLGLIPSIWFFIRWYFKVRTNPEAADFENTMRMNLLSSSGLTGAFIIDLILLVT